MEKDKIYIQMRLVGITATQIRQGAFAIILEEVEGRRRIPIVIGVAEAQSIAICYEKIKPPRPLTHDLFVDYVIQNNALVSDVLISKFEDGIFYAHVHISASYHDDIFLDSRASDAIAIAIRSAAPIYTTLEVLEKTSIVFDNNDLSSAEEDEKRLERKEPGNLQEESIENLEKLLEEYISTEEYEKAAEIKQIIDIKRTNPE